MANHLVISLLRHGLTIANEKRAYIGWTDSPLSERGERSLQAKNYPQGSVQLLFSSPLQRCLATADILFPQQKAQVIEELKEMNFGAWEGKTYDELKDRPIYRQWLNDIFTEPIEAGESHSQFSKSIADGLEKVYERAIDKQVNHLAIVTHGGVIRLMLHILVPEEKSSFAWETPYLAGYGLSWEKDSLIEGEDGFALLAVAPTMGKQSGYSTIIAY